jgi:hypothetical protein
MRASFAPVAGLLHAKRASRWKTGVPSSLRINTPPLSIWFCAGLLVAVARSLCGRPAMAYVTADAATEGEANHDDRVAVLLRIHGSMHNVPKRTKTTLRDRYAGLLSIAAIARTKAYTLRTCARLIGPSE